ncbi:CaiB/BaiF CoA transferase family protein [Sneathiella sp. HT1-7]|uniref:CaiB/BaiF CoA transferase family protein n=1 Tax=Sneathiella sp. HT1-7 TaxID=2887192 RepID=UPI001D13442D|nr:CaiB/BaiF CoA-transferase family protein [Sneathiella sp. HT1-7]MCC3306195.1 CoA transferase [Sneathiella sp. HT1-7]
MGPLDGLKIVELAGIGPAPFCGMMLADMGAEVLRIDRASSADIGLNGEPKFEVLNRGKQSVAVDLKAPTGVAAVLRLVAQADALIEGFRPGVTERLGLGPEVCLKLNPQLVYGRVTGWGQTGPMAQVAGHDANYIALAGVLNAIGRRGEKPVPPINLIGDFGGGGMYLAFGVVSAILSSKQTGVGQVVDAAMIDGALSLMAGIFGMRAEGNWQDERGTNAIDTGAPFYEVYETSDHKYVSIGAIEGRFFGELIKRLELEIENIPDQWDRDNWPTLKEMIEKKIISKTQDEWTAIFGSSDACYAPVLSIEESTQHRHMRERKTFINHEGVVQPAPAPRFSMTEPKINSAPPLPGEHTVPVLEKWGFSQNEITELLDAKVVLSAKLKEI